MKLNTKTQYILNALIDISLNSNGKPVRLEDISKRQNISLNYLEQLIRKVRLSGIVKSIRGPNGGYILARNLENISLKDILKSVNEKTVTKTAIKSDSDESDFVKKFLVAANKNTEDFINSMSLKDLTR